MFQGFFEDPIAFILEYYELVLPIIILGIELFILFIIYVGLSRSFTRRIRKLGLSGETSTGITIIIRIIFFIVAVILVVNAFDPQDATLLSLTTLFGTAVGLAFSQAASGIVSGLYILVARPFIVGDYVRIGEDEGVVTDVTLNYTMIRQPDGTRLRIPSTKVLDSDIENFRVPLKDVIKDVTRERLNTDVVEERSALTRTLLKLRNLTRTEVAYRYTFDIDIHNQFDHPKARRNFDTVSERWSETFLSTPEYQLWETTRTGIKYRFAILVDDPSDIVAHMADFMDDLLYMYREPDSAELADEEME